MTTWVFEVCTPKVIVEQLYDWGFIFHICVVKDCFSIIKDKATFKRTDIAQGGKSKYNTATALG